MNIKKAVITMCSTCI